MPDDDTPTNTAPTETGAGEPAPKNPSTPEEGLSDLKNRLGDLDQQTKRRDALKADLGVLESAAKKIDQTLSDYQQKCDSLKQDFKDLKDYWASKNVMITAALNDKGKAVDKKIQGIQDEIDNKKKEINGKSTDLTNATASYSNAQQALTTYQQTFDNITKIKTDLDQKIQTMKQFKTLIDQEEKNNKLANMYFYAKELKKSLDDTTIKAPPDLTNDLNKAWIDLSKGKTDVREGKLSLDQITADLDAQQKALADLNKKREENILKAIEGLN